MIAFFIMVPSSENRVEAASCRLQAPRWRFYFEGESLEFS
jgi:hypothetical protein